MITAPTKNGTKRLPLHLGAALTLTGWTVLIALSLSWNMRQEQHAMIKQATSEANGHFNKDASYRRWAAVHGGVYVPISETTPPNPYLANLPERDLSTPSGRRLTLVNPAYMTRQVFELSAKQYGVRGHISSLDALRPGNKPDDWEKEALTTFKRGEKEVSSVEEIDGQPYLRFMRPFITEKGCLACHEQQGYRIGDIQGGISVSVPLAPYHAQRHAQTTGLVFWHALIYLAGFAAICWGAFQLRAREQANTLAWEALRSDEKRFRALLDLSRMRNEKESEIISFTLEEAVRLSGSEAGYFHFYDEPSRTINLSIWSKKVESECKISNRTSSYSLDNAGIWADCIRRREPVVHNDYQNIPERKGCPEGHFPIKNHLAVPVFDGELIIGIIGVGNRQTSYQESDITQLSLFAASAWEIIKNRRAELLIHESDRKLLIFRALIDQSSDAIFIVSPANAQFLDVNSQACRMLGYSREELLQIGVYDIDAGQSEKISWQDHVDQLRRLPSFLLESVHKRKDGSTFPVEINVRVFELNEQEYMIAAARNISERKAAEAELLQQRNNLENMVKQRTLDLEDKSADLERSQQALIYLLEDVNEAKKELEAANSKLKELDRLKSMFIASMSHELRTPLNSIIGFTGIMLQGMSGEINEEQRDHMSRVFRAGKHLLSLITDVIDIAKIESGKIVPYPEKFELAALLDEAIGQIRPQADEKGLAITLRLPDHPVTINSDRKRLLQCLLNYLSNAVKFSEKGTVTVEVKTGAKAEEAAGLREKGETIVPGGWLEFSVGDTGIGIRPEDMPLLFGSFVRFESPLKTTTPGTGLGLYLTRKLATEVLGGTVGAESEEGKGSRFWLRLPINLKMIE